MDEIKEINGTDLVIRIDACLKAMGMTRIQLAEFIGKNKQVFTDWKNCKIIPRADDLYKMSKFLGVPMEYLLTGEDIMPDDIACMAASVMTLTKEQRAPLIASVTAQVKFWQTKD